MYTQTSYPDHIPTFDADASGIHIFDKVVDNHRTGVRLSPEDIRQLAQHRRVGPYNPVTTILFFAPEHLAQQWVSGATVPNPQLARNILQYIFTPKTLDCAAELLAVCAPYYNDGDDEELTPLLTTADVVVHDYPGMVLMEVHINLAEILYNNSICFHADKHFRYWTETSTFY